MGQCLLRRDGRHPRRSLRPQRRIQQVDALDLPQFVLEPFHGQQRPRRLRLLVQVLHQRHPQQAVKRMHPDLAVGPVVQRPPAQPVPAVEAAEHALHVLLAVVGRGHFGRAPVQPVGYQRGPPEALGQQPVQRLRVDRELQVPTAVRAAPQRVTQRLRNEVRPQPALDPVAQALFRVPVPGLADLPREGPQLLRRLRQRQGHALELFGGETRRMPEHAQILGPVHQGALGPDPQAGLARHRGQLLDRTRAQRGRGLVPRQRCDPAQPAGLQGQGVGQRRAALVQHQCDRLARNRRPVEQARDAPEAGRQLVAVGDVARVDLMAQAEAVLPVEGVAEADLAQVVALLLVVSALGELVAGVGGADPGVEIGGVVGQHALADEVAGAEALQQGQLGLLELVGGGLGERRADVDGVEMVPEGLGGEEAGGEAPQVGEDGVAVPVGDLGLGAWCADAVEGGEEQEMGDGGAAFRGGPDGEKGVESAGELGGLPEGGREAGVAGGGLERDGGGLVADELGESFGGTEVGLVGDAGLAVDAAGGDDVVVGLVALFLAYDGCHIG